MKLHERLQEPSTLEMLEADSNFPRVAYLTCRICLEDTTLRSYYLKNNVGPYCKYCYKYINEIEETEDD